MKIIQNFYLRKQNLFAQQSGEASEKIFAASQAALAQTNVEPSEKPHTLEEYSFDHFRLVNYVSTNGTTRSLTVIFELNSRCDSNKKNLFSDR